MSQEKTNPRQTDVTAFIDELGAGVLKEQLGYLLSDIAQAQINHGAKNKKCKLSLELNFTQFGNNQQMAVGYKLAHKTLTAKGEKTETTSSESHFFVAKYGKLTVDAPKEDDNNQFALVRENDGERKPAKQINSQLD